ncbi:protein kinase [Terrabacter sp. BE26]|uniref:protein kinase domain-containing protein n=1 Tax=Terrabacter sp. BE26 TaxID=2898152 RepID=UPI0035BE9AC5
MSVDSSPSVRLAQRYLLLERIAVGGMGEVHLATDERLGRRVAVKVLAPVYADSPDFVERFRREALTAAALSHPNIAQVYDYGVDGSAHFIVMEHVEGSDLSRLLREGGRMTPADAVHVAEQVCAALAAAHRAGVVHRDIKPGNVMVRPDGTVKVTDFGIAQALGQASLTETGTVMGTAAYVAPEQARGQATSSATDLYSLGILLFQMLTGAVPFEGDTPVAIAMRHLDEPMPLPSSRVAGLPANLDEVVTRATAKSPRDRYPDADAMAAALRAHEQRAEVATRAMPVDDATAAFDVARDFRRDPRGPARATATQVVPAAAAAGRPTPAGDDDRTVVDAAAGGAPSGTAVMPALGAGLAGAGVGIGAGAGAASAGAAPGYPSPDAAAHPSIDAPEAATSRSAGRPQRGRGPSPLVWGLAGLVVLLVAALVVVLLHQPQPRSVASPGTRPAASAAPTPSSAAPTTTAPPSDGNTVPADLVGRSRGAAVSDLISRGVNVRWVLVRSSQPNDAVLGSYPAPGQPLTKGQTVALVVSRANAPAQVDSTFVVPDGLVGTNADAAMSRIDAKDVRVTQVTIPSAAGAGQVVATWPASGQPTTEGVVVLVVSGGDTGGPAGGPSGDSPKPSKKGDKGGKKKGD